MELVIPMLCAFALWYCYFGVVCFLSRRASGRKLLLTPFQCFWEEAVWNVPGGMTRKTNFIREQVRLKPHGVVPGSSRVWRYTDVAARSLYRECAADTLRSPLQFWVTCVSLLCIGALFGLGLQWLLGSMSVLFLIAN